MTRWCTRCAKSLTDYGDKLDAAEKEKIEAAIKDVEAAIKGDDKADIEAKTETLMTASQKLGEKMYADMQAQQGGDAAAAAAAAGAAGAAAGEAPKAGRQGRPGRGRRRVQGSQEVMSLTRRVIRPVCPRRVAAGNPSSWAQRGFIV